MRRIIALLLVLIPTAAFGVQTPSDTLPPDDSWRETPRWEREPEEKPTGFVIGCNSLEAIQEAFGVYLTIIVLESSVRAERAIQLMNMRRGDVCSHKIEALMSEHKKHVTLKLHGGGKVDFLEMKPLFHGKPVYIWQYTPPPQPARRP